jgi:hypothetical protein
MEEPMKLSQYKLVSKKLYEELEPLLNKHGFKLGKVSAAVDEAFGTVRLTLNLADANLTDASGELTTAEAERWKSHAQYLDLNPEWLGRSFSQGGKLFVIKGLRDGNSKKCVSLERDGKIYVATPEQVQRAFAPLSIAGALKRSIPC